MKISTHTYGRVASVLSIFSYGANFHQAYLNIYVAKGSVILPLFGIIAATCRCLYVNFDPRNPITWSNGVGIVACTASVITYYFF